MPDATPCSVGIAGEDDLDAPDLAMQVSSSSGAAAPRKAGETNGSGGSLVSPSPIRRKGKPSFGQLRPVLGPLESEKLRDRLLSELARLDSTDGALIWAQQILPVKNTLNTGDAQLLEQAFQTKMTTLQNSREDAMDLPNPAAEVGKSQSARQNEVTSLANLNRIADAPPESASIDKSGLTLPEPRRVRDKLHVKFVSKQPCLICGRKPADTHHLRFAQHRALGRKVSDEFTVPLCRGHHRELHRCGDEAEWEEVRCQSPPRRVEAMGANAPASDSSSAHES